MNLFLSASHPIWLIKQTCRFFDLHNHAYHSFPSFLENPEIWIPSPSQVQNRLEFIWKNISLFPTLNLMQSSSTQNIFIHHKGSADFVVEATFIVLFPENNKWYCYICRGHALTTHRSFIKETVRCVLLHLPEGWWAFVYLPRSVSNTAFFSTLDAFPNCFNRDYKTFCWPGSKKLHQQSNDTVDNKSWIE